MSYEVALPDGRVVEFPDSVPREEAAKIIREQLLTKPAEGILAGLGKGAESTLSALRAGVKSIYAPEAAEREARAREEDIARRYADQIGLEKVKEAYQKRGLLPAVGEAAGQIPLAFAEQAPNLAAAFGSARLGAMAGSALGPVGGFVGGVAGAFAPSLVQQLGGDIRRQGEVARAEGRPVVIDRAAALAAAVPQAALDVIGTFVPLGRTLAGKVLGPQVAKMLEKGAEEGAEKLAKESLLKSIAKGTAVGAIAEIPTEVTQQMLERAQAGLPLLTEDALKEYGETAYQVGLLAPIGAAGRVAERGAARERVEIKEELERGKALKEKREQEMAAEQAAEAEKQTPEYALNFMQQHDALQKEYDDLGALLKQKLPPGATFADKQTFEAQKKRRNELATQLKEQAAEYNRAKVVAAPLLQAQAAARAAEQQRAAQAQEARMQEEQQAGPMQQLTLPGMEPQVLTGAEEVAPEAEPVDYVAQANNLRNYLDELRTKAQTTTVLADKLTLGEEYTRIEKALKEAEELAKQAPKPADKQLDLLRKKMEVAEAEGDIPAQVKLAQKLQELGVTDLSQIGAQQALDLGKPRELPPGETTAAFTERTAAARKAEEDARTARQEQARKAFEAAPAVQQDIAGFQRSMGDVVPRREFEFSPQVNDLLDRMAVETEPTQNQVFAGMVQQLKAAPETVQLDRLNAAIRATEAKIAETGGTDIQKTRLANLQKSRGTLEKAVYRKLFDVAEEAGQGELLKRVDAFKPTGAPRRAKGEFQLFGEAEPAAREVTREDLQERLTRAMASNKLSDDAYEFLSRVEATLPEKDRDGIFDLVDQQLQRIESGAEGMAREGAGRKTTLQAFPAEGRADVTGATLANAEDMARQYLFQQKVAEGMKPMQARQLAFKATVAELAEAADATRPALARTLREGTAAVTRRPARDIGKETLRGPSAKAEPLSLQEELEPLLQQIERAREGDMGQMGLFPEEQTKVVTERATPGRFQRFLDSAEAERLRKQFEPEAKKLDRARKQLEELNEKIAKLNAVIADIETVRGEMLPATQIRSLKQELKLLEEREIAETATVSGTTGITERIAAIRQYLQVAEEQQAKLREAEKKFGSAGLDPDSLRNELAEVQKNFGSVLTAVARRSELGAAIAELKVPRNQAAGFIDQFNISDADKALLKEQLIVEEGKTAIGKHLKALTTQFDTIGAALARVDAMVRLTNAEIKAYKYESQEAVDRAALAAAKKELRSAQAAASKLTQQIGGIEARTAAQEAAQRRAANAVNKAKDELARTEQYKARQEALERAQKAPEGVDQFGQPLRSLLKDPITDAERAARENGTPTILAVEMRQVRGNPEQVLKGYRSRITAITKELKAAYDKAREQTLENIKERGPYEAALAAYRSTIASESPELRALETERRELIDKANKEIKDPVARAKEYDRINADINKRREALPSSKNVGRANLEPRLAKLEAAYNAAVANALGARVMPKGLVGYQSALEEMLRREAWLSDLINKGTVEVAPPPKPRRRKTEAELQEIQEVLNQKEVAEAAARVGAPELDVTAKTKSEIEAERKPKGTLYSSKGVGQETTISPEARRVKAEQQALLKEKMSPEERARYAELTLINQALDKQERKEPLNDLEKMLLDEYRRSRKPTKESEVARQEREALEAGEEVEATSEEMREQALARERRSFDAEEVAETGIVKTGVDGIDKLFDSPDTLQQLAATASQGPALKEEVDSEKSAAVVANNVSETGSTEIARAVAERLKLLLGNTRVEIVKDLRDPDGQAAYGQAASDGSFIRLDAKYGLNERTFLHEGVHAATERVIQMPEDQLTPDQLRAKRELEELFEAYKKLKGATNENAKTSLSEFASEALSDDVMQAEMRQQKWTLRHMWDSFKSAILRILGVKTPENMLDATLAAADALMTKVPRPTEADNALLSPKVLNRPMGLNPALAEADAVGRSIVAGNQSWWQPIRAKSSGLAMETGLIDRFAGFERLSKYMDKLKGTQMLYYLRMYDQRMNFTAQSAANGALDLREVQRKDGEREFLVESKTGPSLRQVATTLKGAARLVGDVDATSRLFTLYLAAKRAERVGFDKLDLRGQVTEKQLRETVAQIKSVDGLQEIFDNARDIYNQYNENLVRFAQKAGVLNKEDADALLASKDYIPWYRERNGVAELALGGLNPIKLGNVKDMPHLQELVGGDKPILDFMISSVQNTNMMVDLALRNLATRNAMFELVDMRAAKITNKPVDGANVVRFKHNGEDRYAVLDTETIEVGGKKIDTGVNADILVKGMEGIPLQVTGLLRAATIPTQLLRRVVTLNPLYMVRQLARDSLAASIAAGADFPPVLGALREIESSAKGTLERRGITGGQMFTGTQEDLSKIMRDIVGGRSTLTKALGGLEALGMEADALTRRAQYNSYIKQGMSEMEATLLSLESMNFNKRGASPSAHMANSLYPFFNAQIQGLNVLYRAMFGQITPSERARIKAKLITRGTMLMAATLAYAHAMQDDEAYKNALPAEKYGNWFIRLPGVSEPLRIPIPFEIGYIFKALPEAIYNTIVNERGGEQAKEALLGILRNTIPGGSSYFIPQVMKPAVEVATNYSFFTERPLLSAKEQGLLPEYQYREKTTELAKLFGGSAGVSPIKLEALISGYFSTMGLAALQLASLPLPAKDTPEKAERRLSDMPVIGSAFQPNDARWLINSTYDALDDARKTQASFNELVNRGEKAEARALLDARANDYARAELAGYYRQEMGELTKLDAAIRASNKTPEEKRALLDRVQQAKIKLSAMVRDSSDAVKLKEM